MREILFRGKANNGKWIYGVPVPVTINCYVKGVEIIDEEGIEYDELDGYNPVFGADRVDPETVGQFTGLCDKNGKMIFEGDIVVCRQEICGNWIDYCVEIGFVEMKHGAFGLHRKQGYYRPFKDWLEDYEYEVIGNIHDNPELPDK